MPLDKEVNSDAAQKSETSSQQDKVRVAYSPRLIHRLWDPAAGQKKGNDGYGQFIRGVESVAKGAFKLADMSATMLDHKRRLIPREAKEHEAFILLGSAADIAESREKGLQNEVRKRIRFEGDLAKSAIAEGKIIYGECGALQSIAMFLLGFDLEKYIKPVKEGGQFNHFGNKIYEAAHPVMVFDENSIMGKIAKSQGTWNAETNTGIVEVNSIHKQAIRVKDFLAMQKEIDQFFKDKGKDTSPFVLKLTAMSPDGYVEAMEVQERTTGLPMMNLVQSHPLYTRQSLAAYENLAKDDPRLNIPENPAEKTGNAYIKMLRTQILQSRTQKPAIATREALLEFIKHKAIDQKRGIDEVAVKYTKDSYDMYAPSGKSATITH